MAAPNATTNPLANALQAGQAAIMTHPFAQQLADGIKGLQAQHQRVFGGRGRGALPARRAPSIVVPPRRIGAAPSTAPFAAIIPGDSVGEAVLTTGLINFLALYNSAIVVRLVLTWFPNPPAFIVAPLATVTDPYLNLFRGIIPPLGGTLDLSPILAFVCLNFFSSTAEALPCEGPKVGDEAGAAAGVRKAGAPLGGGNPFTFLQPSRFQQAWDRRVRAQRAMAASKAEDGSQQA